MGFLSKALKSGAAMKAAQVVMREAKKPENQRRAKEFVHKLRNKGGRSA